MSVVRAWAPLLFQAAGGDQGCPRQAAPSEGATLLPNLNGSSILAAMRSRDASMSGEGRYREAVEGWKGVGPGQKGNWSALEVLLRRNEELRNDMAASRRALLWQAKVKTARLKGLLLALKERQESSSLTFFLDDRERDKEAEGRVPSKEREAETVQMLKDLRALAHNETVGTWQEVDQERLPDPKPVVVHSLTASIARAQRIPHWASVSSCVASLRRIEQVSVQIQSLSQARLDAESEAALAEAAQQRVGAQWRMVPAWRESWKDRSSWEEFPTGGLGLFLSAAEPNSPERRERQELAFWAMHMGLLWPMDAPAWSAVPGMNETQLIVARLEGKRELISKLATLAEWWRGEAESFGALQNSSEAHLADELASAQAACGVPQTVLDAVQFSAASGGTPLAGLCSAPELKRAEGRQAGGGSAAESSVPLVHPQAWRRAWVRGPGAQLGHAELALGAPGSSRPVNVSILVVLQHGVDLNEVMAKLSRCTEGLRGRGSPGGEKQIAAEVVIGVDASVLGWLGDSVMRALQRWSKPWLVTRIAFFSDGGAGLPLARAYNVLASVAQGDVLVLYDPAHQWPPTGSCNWLAHLTLSFRAWPRLALLGGYTGHMALYNTPGADYLDLRRTSWEPVHNRLQDPETKERVQFLLGAAFGPLALRRSAFLEVGGFETEGVGSSGALLEYDLCRRFWVAGAQCGMAFTASIDRLGLGKRQRLEKEAWKDVLLRGNEALGGGPELEGRIVAEVKRFNRFLKPLPIWE